MWSGFLWGLGKSGKKIEYGKVFVFPVFAPIKFFIIEN